MNIGNKRGKIGREKESLSQIMDSFIIGGGAKSRIIILAVFLALVCLSTTAFGVGTIKGHIDEPGGSSLVNVWLYLYQGSDPQVADENAWDQVAWAQTDLDGNYQFANLAPRHYHIYISHQDVGGTYYARTDVYNVQVIDNQDTVRDITLQKAGSISGYVRKNSDNSALEGVWVQAFQSPDENIADWRAWEHAGSAQTDATGFYKITGLRERRYRVNIYSQDVGGTRYVDADLYNVQVLAGADTPDMNIMMHEAARIWGYIKSTSGTPIPYADVISDASWTHYGWEWHSAGTDHNGMYELWVLPSPGKFYPVWVRHAWLPGTTYEVYGGTQPLSGQQGYDPESYGYTSLGTGTATKTFSGTYTYYVILTEDGYVAHVDAVEDSSNNILQYLSFGGNVWSPGNVHVLDGQYARVGEAGWNWSQGGYMIFQPPVGHTSIEVHIVNDNRSADPATFESKWEQGNLVRASLTQDTRVDYTLAPGGIATGRVVNESGDGMSDVRVQLGWNKWGDFGDDTWTDFDGYFELGGLTVGNDNYVTMDNWNPIVQDNIKYMSGEAYQGPVNITYAGEEVALPKDFVVYEAGIVTGVVTDENGQPIVDADVDLEGKDIDGNWSEAEDGITDALGQYTLDFVAPGTYTLECKKPGFLLTKIQDIIVGRGQHVDQDVVMNSNLKGATLSGSITNYDQIAAYDSTNNIYYPYYEENDYDEYGFFEFGLIAMDMTKTYTDEDYLDIDRFFVGDLEDDEIEDGYGDYFVPNASETPGKYTMAVPPGDIGIGMYVDNPETLPGWGGSVVLHDWKRFTLTQGDDKPNIDFTAYTGSTGTLKGNILVPPGYNYTPEDWCVIYAFALDSSGNRINPAFLSDAVAWAGFTTRYEFTNMPVGNYQLKAYGVNLPSVVITLVTVSSGTTTQDINFTGVPSGTLSGKITNTNGGAAVSGATVKIVENGKLAVTDGNGDYTMSAMNTGNYTVNITALGFADAQTTVTINAGSNTLDYALDSNVGSISGTVKDQGGINVNAATVVAYNENDYTHKTAQTVGGAFTITGLTPGEYILAVDAGIYGVVVHPDDGSRITLAASQNITDVPIVVGTAQPPVFTVSSSASNTTPVVLSMEFYSDQVLLDAPQVSIDQGSGTLGSLTSNSALNRFNIDYTADASDTLVQIQIAETTPLVSGNPASQIFTFEVSSNLVTTSSTNVTNATGGTASIMGTQDNTEIYVPPFAIAGAGSDTQALSLTIERYGDPGQTFSGTTGSTASAVYDFEFDQQGVTIDTNHTFTVTMSFQLPSGMTQQEFEDTLELRYFDAGVQEWKTDGISNVRINWLNYTIIFEVSHLTKFAVFVGEESECNHPADTNGDDAISMLEILAYIDEWAIGNVSMLDVLGGIDLWAAGSYHCDVDGNYIPGQQP